MSERKQKPLAILEEKVRQLMLMIGFGFIAMIGGLMFSATLSMRVHDRLEATDSFIVRFLIAVVIERFWILAIFPLLVHLAARFLELPLWRTAIIGALTGDLFAAAVKVAGVGIEGTFGDWFQDVVRAATLTAGVLLTVWAGKQGRQWAEKRQQAADVAATGRKAQYDEFLAASTALADKREAAAANVAVPAVVPSEPVAALPVAAEAPQAAPPAVDPKPQS